MQLDQSYFFYFFSHLMMAFMTTCHCVQEMWSKCNVGLILSSIAPFYLRSFLLCFLYSPSVVALANIISVITIHLGVILAPIVYVGHVELYNRVKMLLVVLVSVLFGYTCSGLYGFWIGLHILCSYFSFTGNDSLNQWFYRFNTRCCETLFDWIRARPCPVKRFLPNALWTQENGMGACPFSCLMPAPKKKEE